MRSSSVPEVPVLAFADYATADRARRTELVTPRPEVDFYGPLLRALRRAAVSDDPAGVLDAAVAEVTDAGELTGQPRAYREAADGFLAWWERVRATPVDNGTSRLRIGEVDISVVPHLALRTGKGLQVALFHLKEAPLTRDAANAALRVLGICVADLVPGASPLVVDLRRAKEFRLSANTNLTKLDTWLTAQAAAYATHLRETV